MRFRIDRIVAAPLVVLCLMIAHGALNAMPARGTFGASVELPWKTFSEQAKDAVAAAFASCPGGREVFVAYFERDGWLYQSFFATETGVYILVIYPAGARAGAMPIALGVGKVDMETPGAHDRLPELRWEPFNPEVHRNPCDILYPASA